MKNFYLNRLTQFQFVKNKLRIKFTIFSLALFLFQIQANGRDYLRDITSMAQQQQITGKVIDEESVPLSGVSVVVKGTTQGVAADFDGNYSIEAGQGDILVFSYIGYSSQEITVGSQTVIDVTLKADVSTLDEVVVIGFGEKKKRDLTGSISTIKTADIQKTGFASPQFALQGNTTGVRVINASGNPNAAPQVYVRGIGSWQGNAQPLYVVDGQIITPPTAGNLDQIGGGQSGQPPNLFTMINPDDIESISVLKDASAAAIYGSRGANGVILVTTKSGKSGKSKMTYDARVGFQNVDSWDVLNTQQYREVVTEAYTNSLNPDLTIEDELYGRNAGDDITRRVSFSPQFDPQSPFYINSNATYDWSKSLVRKAALMVSHDLSFSGGNEKTNYYAGLGFDDQESSLIGNELRTYRASINLDSQINSWLKIGVNTKIAYQQQDLEDYGGLTDFAQVAPWQPLFDANNEFGYQAVIDPPAGNWQSARIYGQGGKNNYLAFKDLNRRLFENQRYLGQVYLEVQPLEGLKIRASLNLDYVAQDRITTRTYRSNIFNVVGTEPGSESPEAPNSFGQHESRVNNIFNYQFDFLVNYQKSFGKHNFDITAALQDQFQRTQFKNISSLNLTNINNLKRIGFGNDLLNNSSIVGWNERFWFGYVGRLSYNFDSKYYLDLSYRRDATSGLAKDNRWGNFYSASGAWRISAEPFMRNVEFINDLKLRGGYGEAGNDEAIAGQFAYLSTISDRGSYSFGSGNGDAQGNRILAVSLPSVPNPSLVWEVAETTNVGLDATLFDYQFDLTVEVYRRRQNGIQQTVNLPPSVGSNPPIFNIGLMENRGLDLSMGYNGKFGDFNFGVRGNLSLLENEVIELYNNQPLFVTNQFGRQYYVEEGRPIGTIWGYKVGGMFQSQQEIDEFYANTPDNQVANNDFVAPGDLYFQDVHGDPTEDEPFYSETPDGQINANDRTDIGNTIPGYTYGLNVNAGFKNFDFVLSFYGEGDVEGYNYARAALEGMSGPSNFSTSVLNRWTPTNTDTDIPRAVAGDPAVNNRFSDRFVESAAFFRLNNWQIGYTFPANVFENSGEFIKSLRLYLGGQNNIYIHKWSGLDPVNDGFPLPKTFMMGLKATF